MPRARAKASIELGLVSARGGGVVRIDADDGRALAVRSATSTPYRAAGVCVFVSAEESLTDIRSPGPLTV